MGDVREVLWWIRRVTIEAENVEKSIIKFGEWMGIWRFVWIPFKCHCWRNQWKRRKYFSCFAPLLLREIQIFKFLAPAKKKKCSRPGEKKKRTRDLPFAIDFPWAWVPRECVTTLFLFSSRRVAGGDLVFLLMSAFFLADGDFFPAHYPFTNVSQLIVTFSNKKICEQNTQNVVPVSNMMLNDE